MSVIEASGVSDIQRDRRATTAGLLLLLAVWSWPQGALGAAVAPTLPTRTVSALPPDAPGGRVIILRSGADLQKALDSVKANDTLVLEAGATWIGNFYLPRRSDPGWVTIRGSSEATLPRSGHRVSPANGSAMPKILTPNSNPALTANDGIHGWRFVGLELGVVPNFTGVVYQLLLIGWGSGAFGRRTNTDVVASRFIVERCYIHGSPPQRVRKGILANGADVRIADSWIGEIHDGGFDSQAILGYDGSGPLLIENNELQASSENIMLGGSDPSSPDLLPSDIVISRNHLVKPLRWKRDDPGYDGHAWVIKPLIELKIAQRVLIEGNILENSWLWPAFVADSGGSFPWMVVQDVIFRYNLILNSVAPWQSWSAGSPVRRLAILHNLSDGAIDPGSGNVYTRGAVGNFMSSKTFPIEDLWIEHNTIPKAARGITISGASYMPRLTIKNNAFPFGPAVEGYWLWKDSGNPNPYWAVNAIAPDREIRENALFGSPRGPVRYDDAEFRIWSGAGAAGVNPDGSLHEASPLRRAATDGTDIGVDFAALNKAARAPEPANRP